MSYKLNPVGNGIFILQNGDVPCTCPIKASFPQQVKAPQPDIVVENHEPPKTKIIFVGQQCRSDCPLFEIHEDNSVELHCGNGRAIKIVEEPK